MSKIYKLKLKLKSGLLSEVHSDTTFGHFAWRFLESHGEPELKSFLQRYLDRNPVFTISDGMFELEDHKRNIHEHFFPKPAKLTPYKVNAGSKKERIKQMISHKESKKQNLISLKQLNFYINGDINDFDESFSDDYHSQLNYPKFLQDLRVNVEIDRYTLSSQEGQLFTYSPKFTRDNVYIFLLIKVLDEEAYEKYNCEAIIKSVFEIGYGKKKSSGFGHFDIEEYAEFNKINEPEEPNGFVSLSHYIPSINDNLEDIHYSLNVKYGKLGEQYSLSANPFKAPIILLEPGTVVLTNQKSEFYGKAVNNIIDLKPDVLQNGIAFTLKTRL